jgi:transposase
MISEKKMRNSKYTKEFKDSTVQLAMNSDESMIKIAEDLGVHIKTLYAWIRAYKNEHNISIGHSRVIKDQSKESLNEENTRLRRENKLLKQERDILKKATAYFAKETL